MLARFLVLLLAVLLLADRVAGGEAYGHDPDVDENEHQDHRQHHDQRPSERAQAPPNHRFQSPNADGGTAGRPVRARWRMPIRGRRPRATVASVPTAALSPGPEPSPRSAPLSTPRGSPRPETWSRCCAAWGPPG